MPRVTFTGNLHRLVDAPPAQVHGNTVREALEAALAHNPRLRGYLLDDQGALRRHIVVFVGGRAGSWIYGKMGLLDGLFATNRKEPDKIEATAPGMVPIDRLALIAPRCKISRARVVDAGRIVTAGGIASGMELGFHLLRRAGFDEAFIAEVARVMEYAKAYELYRDDRV